MPSLSRYFIPSEEAKHLQSSLDVAERPSFKATMKNKSSLVEPRVRTLMAIEYVDREGELRPARPASGLGLSWAAKEFVQRQLAEERSRRAGSTAEAGDAGEQAAGGIPPEETR